MKKIDKQIATVSKKQMEGSTTAQAIDKKQCEHEFVDRIVDDIRWSIYSGRNIPSKRVIIYCKKCGLVTKDKNTSCLD